MQNGSEQGTHQYPTLWRTQEYNKLSGTGTVYN